MIWLHNHYLWRVIEEQGGQCRVEVMGRRGCQQCTRVEGIWGVCVNTFFNDKSKVSSIHECVAEIQADMHMFMNLN